MTCDDTTPEGLPLPKWPHPKWHQEVNNALARLSAALAGAGGSSPVDIPAGKWNYEVGVYVPHLPRGATYPMGVAVGEDVYVIGGQAASNTLGTIHRYNPTTDAGWEPLTPYVGYLTDGETVYHPSRHSIFVLDSGNNILEYDITADSWSDTGVTMGAIASAFVHSNGNIYGAQDWTIREYDPSTNTVTNTTLPVDVNISGWVFEMADGRIGLIDGQHSYSYIIDPADWSIESTSFSYPNYDGDPAYPDWQEDTHDIGYHREGDVITTVLNDQYEPTVYEYDVAADTWTYLTQGWPVNHNGCFAVTPTFVVGLGGYWQYERPEVTLYKRQ